MKIKGRQLTTADLLRVLRRSLLLLLACALLGGAVGYFLAVRRAQITYTATADVYVQAASVDMEVGQTSNEIALGRAYALSCRDAIHNNTLYENVRAYFAARQEEGWPDLSGITNDAIGGMITASVENNAQVVTVSVTAPNGELAIRLANAIADELENSVTGIIGNCRIEPIRWADTGVAASTFSLSLAFALALFCFFAAYAAALLLYIFDPRVRNVQELCDLCGDIPLLGTDMAAGRKGGHA